MCPRLTMEKSQSRENRNSRSGVKRKTGCCALTGMDHMPVATGRKRSAISATRRQTRMLTASERMANRNVLPALKSAAALELAVGASVMVQKTDLLAAHAAACNKGAAFRPVLPRMHAATAPGRLDSTVPVGRWRLVGAGRTDITRRTRVS